MSEEKAQRPNPGRVALTLLLWAAGLAVTLMAIRVVAFIFLFSRLGSGM